MTPETKKQKTTNDFKNHLMMLVILATEMEKYGYAVKGHTNEQFEYRLTQLLNTSKLFLDFVNAYIDEDELSDTGEKISKQIQRQLNKR